MKIERKSTAMQSAAASTLNGEGRRERIAKKAYERYLNRGQLDGYDLDDWLEAEQQVVAESGDETGKRRVTGRVRGKKPQPQTG
jgi:Protein of unknown function (DUF2934)